MSAEVKLTKLALALRNQVNRELFDFAFDHHSMLALLAGMENAYRVKGRFTRTSDVKGEKLQLDYRKSAPNVTGAKAETGSVGSLELPAQENYESIGGTMSWSYYQLREDIRTIYIDQYTSATAKAQVPVVKQIASGARDAIFDKFTKDMFPLDDLFPSRDGGGAATTDGNKLGAHAEDKIMAIAYPLQTGRRDNDTTESTPAAYSYLGIDLNVETALRAINSGEYDSAFGNPTASALRRKLILPLRNRGHKADLGVTDSDTYDYLATNIADPKVVIESAETLEYGGEYIRALGVNWMVEPRMDDKLDDSENKKEIYLLTSDSWEFRQVGVMGDLTIRENPNTALLHTMLGRVIAAWACKHPRANARGYNITS